MMIQYMIHAIFTVLLFTRYTVPHANQKMFFSCTVLSILYILEEVMMCPVLFLVLEFLNFLRNVSTSSSTNLTKPGSSISSSTLQIILPHYHSSNYGNHLLQHLHLLCLTQKYHTHIFIEVYFKITITVYFSLACHADIWKF